MEQLRNEASTGNNPLAKVKSPNPIRETVNMLIPETPIVSQCAAALFEALDELLGG